MKAIASYAVAATLAASAMSEQPPTPQKGECNAVQKEIASRFEKLRVPELDGPTFKSCKDADLFFTDKALMDKGLMMIVYAD